MFIRPPPAINLASVALLCLATLATEALARIEFNAQGQLIALSCDPARIADDERILCGVEAPTWANVYDHDGRLRRQLLHAAGQLTASREFSPDGVVAYEQERSVQSEGDPPRSVEQLRRRTYDPAGWLRIESVSANGRVQYERELNAAGSEVRLTRWNARDQKSETRWYPNRVVARQEWPAVYEGSPARMIQEYWENGQIRARGTLDDKDQRLGLYQTFHPAAGLASESFYADGRMTRRREFDERGRLLVEEEFLADGSRRSLMQR